MLVDAVRADGRDRPALSRTSSPTSSRPAIASWSSGGGTTLLDLSIAGAIAEHHVAGGRGFPRPLGTRAARPATRSAGLPGPAGEPLSARARHAGRRIGRAATLEEVVLGHLAAAHADGPRSTLASERAVREPRRGPA